MLERAEALAQEQADTLSAQAVDAARGALDLEIGRLTTLRRVNPGVREEEIAALTTERDALLTALPASRLRLDAVRLVASPDFLALR
jgi:ATP-dependent helicase HepA